MALQGEKTVSPQLNLTLIDQPALTLPREKQTELGLALLELLLSAVRDRVERLNENQAKGDRDHDESNESQTHC